MELFIIHTCDKTSKKKTHATQLNKQNILVNKYIINLHLVFCFNTDFEGLEIFQTSFVLSSVCATTAFVYPNLA